MKSLNRITMLALFTGLFFQQACGIGQTSLDAESYNLSSPVYLQKNYDSDTGTSYAPLGEFELQADSMNNFALVTVLQIGQGWNSSIYYRVWARQAVGGSWTQMAYNINTAPCSGTVSAQCQFKATPPAGTHITDFTEWLVEFQPQSYQTTSTVLVQDIVSWGATN